MEAYQHVVVVMSIILGLSVTQLLKGAAQLYRNRNRVRPYRLHTAWVVLLVFFSFLVWWTFWNYRSITEWDFFRFVIYLSPAITFYFIAALAMPEPADAVGSMREYYFGNRVGIFGTLALYGLLAGITAIVVRGLPLFDASNLFRVLMIVAALVLVRSASERVHALVFAAFVTLTAVFVLLFQYRLQ